MSTEEGDFGVGRKVPAGSKVVGHEEGPLPREFRRVARPPKELVVAECVPMKVDREPHIGQGVTDRHFTFVALRSFVRNRFGFLIADREDRWLDSLAPGDQKVNIGEGSSRRVLIATRDSGPFENRHPEPFLSEDFKQALQVGRHHRLAGRKPRIPSDSCGWWLDRFALPTPIDRAERAGKLCPFLTCGCLVSRRPQLIRLESPRGGAATTPPDSLKDALHRRY